MSATLSVEGPQGRSIAHIRRQLGLGGMADRLVVPKRVDAPWRYNIPVMITPSRKGGARAPVYRLAPPRDPQQSSAWHDAVAAVIAHDVATTAAGGTLVLCPSYELIEALSERLEAALGARLVTQTRDEPFARPAQRFRHRMAERPVWLATGPAWEGLDLSLEADQVPPERDFLLTDLVVPRIPFGVVQSTTHRARLGGPSGYQVMRDEASFRFRQGLGRLIRRPGVSARRIWMLDGRPWTGRARNQKAFYEPFRLVVAAYGQQETLARIPRGPAS